MSCPPLESLWLGREARDPLVEAHLRACPRCEAALEAHRLLESDLSRLVEAPPPPDFVASVMAKVDAAPHPFSRELLKGGAVLGLAALLLVLLLPLEAFQIEDPVGTLWALVLALGQALEVTAAAASVTGFAALLAMLTLCTIGLRVLVRERMGEA